MKQVGVILMMFGSFSVYAEQRSTRLNLMQVLENCAKSCSDECEGYTAAIEDRLDTYFERCQTNKDAARREEVRPGVSREPSRVSAAPKRNFKCTFALGTAHSSTSEGRRGGQRNSIGQENFDGYGASPEEALRDACTKCGGNRTVVTSLFATTYRCEFGACVDAYTGEFLDDKIVKNLIPAECTESSNKIKNFRQ